MQYISLLLLLISIVLITISYVKEYVNTMEKNVEYRYIPRTLYDDQIGNTDLNKTYDELFMKSNPGPFGLDTKND